jgi:hypothetical protein
MQRMSTITHRPITRVCDKGTQIKNNICTHRSSAGECPGGPRMSARERDWRSNSWRVWSDGRFAIAVVDHVGLYTDKEQYLYPSIFSGRVSWGKFCVDKSHMVHNRACPCPDDRMDRCLAQNVCAGARLEKQFMAGLVRYLYPSIFSGRVSWGKFCVDKSHMVHNRYREPTIGPDPP